MAKNGYKSQAQLDAERSERDAKREERVATFDTNAPNVEQKRKLEAMQKGALIADEIERRGGTIPLDGINEVGQPVSTLGMTENEKFFAQGRMRDKQQLGEFKSFGDKSAFETKNAIRKLQGLPELDANPLTQFRKDIDKSMTFLDKSALLTPEGQQRALKAGVAAGLSFEDADAAVQTAFQTLQKRQKGSQPAPSVTTPVTTPVTTTDTAPVTPVQTETKPPEVRDTSPDVSASASHRARQRGRAAEGKPTEVVPENMGEPTGPPTPATAIPVKTSLGTVWTDTSGYTYPSKPKPYNPEESGFVSGAELWNMTGVPRAYGDLKSGISYAGAGFAEEYEKAKKESPTTPLRSASKGAWEALVRSMPSRQWWTQGL